MPRLLLISVLWLALTLPAAATRVGDLYEAAVPVTSQTAETRERALREALAAVLVKATGRRGVNDFGDTQHILLRASDLVQRFGFEADPATGELRLRAQFDGNAVTGALRDSGLPVWGETRPAHLLWVALRDDGQPRAILDQTVVAQRAPALRDAASARGLPVTFPLMDLEDERNLDFADITGAFDDRILAASRRYRAPHVVAVAMGREGGIWVGRWTWLAADGSKEFWLTTESSLEHALAEGIHALADRQGQLLALRTASGFAEEAELRVSGVRGLRDYGRLLEFVRGLNMVRAAGVVEVTDDLVRLRLRVEGGLEGLERGIASGSLLRRAQPDQQRFMGGYGGVLEYVIAD
jgi:uncharacterized protein